MVDSTSTTGTCRATPVKRRTLPQSHTRLMETKKPKKMASRGACTMLALIAALMAIGGGVFLHLNPTGEHIDQLNAMRETLTASFMELKETLQEMTNPNDTATSISDVLDAAEEEVVEAVAAEEVTEEASEEAIERRTEEQEPAALEEKPKPNRPYGTQVDIGVKNEARIRADLYFDDGRFGSFIRTLNPGESFSIGTYVGHRFFWTSHGVRNQLVAGEGEGILQEPLITGDIDAFTLPSDARPREGRCLDRYKVCAAEAARNGCHTNPGWMTVNCCESCDPHIGASELLDPNVRCGREQLGTQESLAWGPGDLNRMFERIVSAPEFQQYEPKVLSHPGDENSGPWVVTLDNFLTDAEVDGLIKGGEMAGFERSTDQGRVNSIGEMEKVQSRSRTSSNAWCNGACEKLPLVQQVSAKIEHLTGVRKGNYESFQILSYDADQFYKAHHDASARDHRTPAGPRILTVFLYLSDVDEGGHTAFTKLGLSVPPKKGKALIWPSVLDADPAKIDHRMFHEAQPVVAGHKIAANHWIHLYDFVKPNLWGCTGSFS